MLIALTMSPATVIGQDLIMKDTPSDNGTEPNPDSGPMWVSEDIWIRQDPDPNWEPYPFTTASPSWTPLPHQNAEYRHTKYSKPNWIYVRIENKGEEASSGNEVLKLYWAKASTGLGWGTHWGINPITGPVDYFHQPSFCNDELFLSEEVTKPRRNAAEVSDNERERLKEAFVQLDAIKYSDDVSYWDKQDQIHQATHVHCTPEFLPWHRELINRLENLLREVHPEVKLHYWDWTTDPTGNNPVPLFTTDFMGSDNDRAGTPFGDFDANGCTGSRGRDSQCGCDPIYTSICPGTCPETNEFEDPPPIVTRQVGVNAGLVTTTQQNTVLGKTTYPSFRTDGITTTHPCGSGCVCDPQPSGLGLEAIHNGGHAHIGGTLLFPHCAFEDPFVYLLHSQTDRIFAKWQRDEDYVERLDASQVYESETSDLQPLTLAPWNGSLEPWVFPNDETIAKTYFDASVVSPPIYDDAPLRIPKLAKGESVILQIPWYPEDPSHYACFGADQKHFCLLARIVDGMTYPEIYSNNESSSTVTNVRNNNNIVWRNIVVDDELEGGGLWDPGCVLVRKIGESEDMTMRFRAPRNIEVESPIQNGSVMVDIGDSLNAKWVRGGRQGSGITYNGTVLTLTANEAWIGNMLLEQDESYTICPEFDLDDLIDPFILDIQQEENDTIVGGERYVVDLQDGGHKREGNETSWSRFEDRFTLLPNPAEDEVMLIIRDTETPQLVRISDVRGRALLTEELPAETTLRSIDVSTWPSGLYFVVITDRVTKGRFVQKLVIR